MYYEAGDVLPRFSNETSGMSQVKEIIVTPNHLQIEIPEELK